MDWTSADSFSIPTFDVTGRLVLKKRRFLLSLLLLVVAVVVSFGNRFALLLVLQLLLPLSLFVGSPGERVGVCETIAQASYAARWRILDAPTSSSCVTASWPRNTTASGWAAPSEDRKVVCVCSTNETTCTGVPYCYFQIIVCPLKLLMCLSSIYEYVFLLKTTLWNLRHFNNIKKNYINYKFSLIQYHLSTLLKAQLLSRLSLYNFL